MLDKKIIDREKWLNARRQIRSNNLVSRKLIQTPRKLLEGRTNSKIQKLEHGNDDLLPSPKIKSKTQVNPFPFSRQHKSKVIYRNLGQPIILPTYAGSKIFSHTSKIIDSPK